MHNNNNNQCKMCWNKTLTRGADSDVGSVQLSFHTTVYPVKVKVCVLNPNVTPFLSNCTKFYTLVLSLYAVAVG